jgi:tetratricopeptide (TPR) repeat protein
LNYLDDTNEDVMPVLAWVLTIDGRFDEAKRYFAQLMSQEQPQADCFLYYGYCLWFSGEIAEAIKIFRRYLNSGNGNQENLEKAFFVTENDIIAKYHIGRSEAQMMLDALRD